MKSVAALLLTLACPLPAAAQDLASSIFAEPPPQELQQRRRSLLATSEPTTVGGILRRSMEEALENANRLAPAEVDQRSSHYDPMQQDAEDRNTAQEQFSAVYGMAKGAAKSDTITWVKANARKLPYLSWATRSHQVMGITIDPLIQNEVATTGETLTAEVTPTAVESVASKLPYNLKMRWNPLHHDRATVEISPTGNLHIKGELSSEENSLDLSWSNGDLQLRSAIRDDASGELGARYNLSNRTYAEGFVTTGGTNDGAVHFGLATTF